MKSQRINTNALRSLVETANKASQPIEETETQSEGTVHPMTENASGAYADMMLAVDAAIKSVSAKVKAHSQKQKSRNNDWGYVGDLQNVLKHLREIESFLGSGSSLQREGYMKSPQWPQFGDEKEADAWLRARGYRFDHVDAEDGWSVYRNGRKEAIIRSDSTGDVWVEFVGKNWDGKW
jgi:hypothetical protein